MNGHIEAMWQSYRNDVIPKDARTVQLVESRRAFFAGANALNAIMMRNLSPDEEPTAEDLQLMGDIDRELKQFCGEVKAGSA